MKIDKTLDFKGIITAYNANKLRKMDKDFLPQICNIIADEIELVYEGDLISSTKTLNNIKNKNVKYLISVLYQIPRSVLLGVSAAKNPMFASLTPIVMYAFKQRYGICYENWDKTDPQIKYMLGKFLEGLIDFPSSVKNFENKKYPNKEELQKYRDVALTTTSTGEIKKVTDFKMNLTLFNDETKEYWSVSERLPKVASYLLLQTWIAHSTLRCPNIMILDPYNWDHVPEAYDQEVVEDIFEVKKYKKKDLDLDLPF